MSRAPRGTTWARRSAPPPPTSSPASAATGATTTTDEEKLERLRSLLRDIHGRLTAEPGLPYDEWELQLYAYDEALVTAADVLDVPVPPGARDEMGPGQRTAIEQGLADAGFDIWSEE